MSEPPVPVAARVLAVPGQLQRHRVGQSRRHRLHPGVYDPLDGARPEPVQEEPAAAGVAVAVGRDQPAVPPRAPVITALLTYSVSGSSEGSPSGVAAVLVARGKGEGRVDALEIGGHRELAGLL